MKQKMIAVTLLVVAGLLVLTGVQMVISLQRFPLEVPKIHPLVIYNDEDNLSGIAAPMLNAYLEKSKPVGSQSGTGSEIESFEMQNARIIAKGNGLYAIAIIFRLSPEDANYLSLKSRGIVDRRKMLNCEWTFVVRKVNDDQYVLIDTQLTKDFIPKLGISQSKIDMLLFSPTVAKNVYQVKHNNVYVTYDSGITWKQLPIQNFDKFAGKDSDGHPYMDSLFAGSVHMSSQKSAFVFTSGEKDGKLQALLSNDSGKSWHTKLIDDRIPEGFNPCVQFSQDGKFGIAAVQSHKSIEKAETNLYVTYDGGDTWTMITKMSTFLLSNITFSNEKIGFLTFSNDRSSLYTSDGGKTWKILKLQLPPQYEDIFSNQLAPSFNGKHGEIILNIGGNNGCSGEWQTATFVTEDAGLTWKFDKIHP